jgi:transcriptional regulator with XRE-family HTH domain
MSRKKSTIDQKRLKKFGEQLFLLRKSTGMSQREFAATIGISKNYVSYLENGKSAPSQTLLRSIKSQYMIDFDKLLSATDDIAEGFEPYDISTRKQEKSIVYEPPGGYSRRDDHVAHIKKIAMLLQKTLITLESKTDCGFALEHNINAFYAAVIKEWETKEDPTNDKGVGDNSNNKSIRR